MDKQQWQRHCMMKYSKRADIFSPIGSLRNIEEDKKRYGTRII